MYGEVHESWKVGFLFVGTRTVFCHNGCGIIMKDTFESMIILIATRNGTPQRTTRFLVIGKMFVGKVQKSMYPRGGEEGIHCGRMDNQIVDPFTIDVPCIVHPLQPILYVGLEYPIQVQ